MDVPSGALLGKVLGPALQRYAAGDTAEADADTFFDVELPSMQEWFLTREDARRMHASGAWRVRLGERLCMGWLA